MTIDKKTLSDGTTVRLGNYAGSQWAVYIRWRGSELDVRDFARDEDRAVACFGGLTDEKVRLVSEALASK